MSVSTYSLFNVTLGNDTNSTGYYITDNTNAASYSSIHVIYHEWLNDCSIGWQESIVITLDSLIFLLTLFFVIYFSHTMFKQNKKFKNKYKYLITMCHILYTISSALVVILTYLMFGYGCSWHIYFTALGSIRVIYYQFYYCATLLVYFIFSQRFMDSVKGSLFDVGKMKKYYFYATYCVLFLIWIYACIMDCIFQFYFIYNQHVISSQFLTLLSYSRNWVVVCYIVCSIITMGLFAHQLKRVILFVKKTNVVNVEVNVATGAGIRTARHGDGDGKRDINGYGKKQAMYVTIVSRTTVLLCIALISTLLAISSPYVYIQISQYHGYDPYLHEFVEIMFTIDMMVNVLCLNMQTMHGKSVYQWCKCIQLENKVKTCILCCYSLDHCKNK